MWISLYYFKSLKVFCLFLFVIYREMNKMGEMFNLYFCHRISGFEGKICEQRRELFFMQWNTTQQLKTML